VLKSANSRAELVGGDFTLRTIIFSKFRLL
jgi:hypothetical protein